MGAIREIDILFLSAATTEDMSMLQRLSELYINGDVARKVCYDTICIPEGYNALHLAAKSGKTEACRFLIENLKFEIDGTNGAGADGVAAGETALFLSILYKHLPTTIFLIANGADIHKRTVLGETPLHYAARYGSKETLELLLSKGADLNASSVWGMPVHVAASSGNHVALKYLLGLNADPNPSTSYNELTPLYAALKAEARECVKLLLEAGADPNIPCFLGTPLKWAACKLDVEITEWLLNAGADPNWQDSEGYTPLEAAAFDRPRDVLELLFSVTSPISKYPHWGLNEVIQYQRTFEVQLQRILKFREIVPLVKAKAGEAFRRQNYADAFHWYFQASLGLSGEVDAKLLSNRSLCAAQLNMGKRALADAQECISLNPRWAKAHYREGAALNVLMDFKKAVEAFSRALALDPDNEEMKNAYMEARAKRNKFKYWNEYESRSNSRR